MDWEQGLLLLWVTGREDFLAQRRKGAKEDWIQDGMGCSAVDTRLQALRL